MQELELSRISGKAREQDPELLASAARLGFLYSARGDFAKAEPLVRQFLQDTRQFLGEQHPVTIQGMFEAAQFYEEWKRFAEAEPLRRQLLAAAQKSIGPESLKAGINTSKLAFVVRLAGGPRRPSNCRARPSRSCASKMTRRPWRTRCASSATPCPTRRRRRHSTARTWPSARKPSAPKTTPSGVRASRWETSCASEAVPGGRGLFRRTIEEGRKAGKPNHLAVLTAMDVLGRLYEDQNDWDKAEQLRREFIATAEKTVGKESRGVVEGLTLLGNLLLRRGQYDQASESYRRAITLLRTRGYPGSQRDLAKALHNLGRVEERQGDPVAAERCYREAFTICDDGNFDVGYSIEALETSCGRNGGTRRPSGFTNGALRLQDADRSRVSRTTPCSKAWRPRRSRSRGCIRTPSLYWCRVEELPPTRARDRSDAVQRIVCISGARETSWPLSGGRRSS